MSDEQNMKTKDLLAMLKPQEEEAVEENDAEPVVEDDAGEDQNVDVEEGVDDAGEAPENVESELEQLRREKQQLTELIQQYSQNTAQLQQNQNQQQQSQEKTMEEMVNEIASQIDLDEPASVAKALLTVAQQSRQQAVQDAVASTANQVKTMQTIDRFFNKPDNQALEPFRDIIITKAMNLEAKEENQGKSPVEILNLASEDVRKAVGSIQPQQTQKPQRNFARVSQTSNSSKTNGQKKNLSKDESDFLKMYKMLNGGR